MFTVCTWSQADAIREWMQSGRSSWSRHNWGAASEASEASGTSEASEASGASGASEASEAACITEHYMHDTWEPCNIIRVEKLLVTCCYDTPTHTHPHSGGTNYTITGTNLNSVQQPRLLFYVEGVAELGRRRRQTAGQNYVQSQVCTEHTWSSIYTTSYVINFSTNYHISEKERAIVGGTRVQRLGWVLDWTSWAHNKLPPCGSPQESTTSTSFGTSIPLHFHCTFTSTVHVASNQCFHLQLHSSIHTSTSVVLFHWSMKYMASPWSLTVLTFTCKDKEYIVHKTRMGLSWTLFLPRKEVPY